MKKLLLILLAMCLHLPCASAGEQIVHVMDLSDTTLLLNCTPVDEESAALDVAGTVYDVTPSYEFLQYQIFSTRVYAAADGSAWLVQGEKVHRLTGADGRLTSVCPIMTDWQHTFLLYTRQHEGGTDVCCIDLQTGEQQTLLTTPDTVVLISINWHLFYSRYTPLPDYGGVLLCTARLSQPDMLTPALCVTLEKVVGDVAVSNGTLSASIRKDGHCAVEYGGERADSLHAFAGAYRQLYPDHNLSNPSGSICERTYLTGNAAYGRVYEVAFSGYIYLWKDGQAHVLADGTTDSLPLTGLEEAVLTDLDDDGTEEIVFIYQAGSGIPRHCAAFYNPVTGRRTLLRTNVIGGAQDEMHVRMEEGMCCLYQGDVLLGEVTNVGLDTAGFELTDLLQLMGY